MAAEAQLRGVVEAWIADDPDAGDRAELKALIDRAFAAPGTGAGSGGGEPAVAAAEAALAELRDRFAGRLEFGTAGLRGAVAAGPNRMNRAVVRAATAAVAGWLLGDGAGSARSGGWLLGDGAGSARSGGWLPEANGSAGSGASVVVGCDARHRSADFAAEAAGVLAGAGVSVHVLPLPCPTPLLAFAVRHLAASAGVMITASHNPAADNGYKLYLSDGAQVIPPVDAQIEERIAALGPLSQVRVADPGSPLITRHGDEVARAYLDAVVAASAGPAAERRPLTVVYTPMHGVAGPLMLRAMARAGFAPPHVVARQADPDPDFPTVAFPNPEEPGALDLALADARRFGADLVVASDPDGDRLAVAVPEPAGGWRVLTGDQVGALLGASLLERTAGSPAPRDRLVASTIVSSTLLSAIAVAAGARYAETLTGFKWITRAGDGVPAARFLFGYEEALGYAVGDVVRDKDGIGAALAMMRLATDAASAGRSVLDRYDELEIAHGVHLTSQVTLRTTSQAQVMSRLRAAPPAVLGGEPVSSMADLAEGGSGLPPADVLVFRLPGARVVLRPSGTEPKIKCYIEVVEPLDGRSLVLAREAAAGRLAPLRSAVEAVLAG
ncbi:MAG TPA: phospho-sugar mutase [Streptosporangiaceae bacterium]|nr:phospho-sugar mutase [Streptosporangiaceae bacterium]